MSFRGYEGYGLRLRLRGVYVFLVICGFVVVWKGISSGLELRIVLFRGRVVINSNAIIGKRYLYFLK